MPELPEVEAVTRLLRSDAIGGVIRKTEVFRPRAIRPQKLEDFRLVANARIDAVDRVGKHIVVRLTKKAPLDVVIKAHLGMTGNFHVIPDARLHSSYVRVLFTLKDGRGIAMDDSRIFGTVQVYRADELDSYLEHVGVDPLTKAFSPKFLAGIAATSKKPAKVLLMDQSPIAGLGNIYAAEALFRAKLNPFLPIPTDGTKLTALHKSIKGVLNDAIARTVKAYRSPGHYQDMKYEVYGRKGQPCRVCKSLIEKRVQAGRSTFYCPACQIVV